MNATQEPAAQILVIGPQANSSLLAALERIGLQADHLDDPARIAERLAQTAPIALLVDVAFAQQPLAGIEAIKRLRDHTTLTAPVFFIAARSDLDTRLKAVAAGGAGYFVKPVATAALLEALQKRLFDESLPGYFRALIVAEHVVESRRLAHLLEQHGIVAQVTAQPQQALEALEQFRPDVLVLDLDLEEINGLHLARVLRQHPGGATVPLLLLTRAANFNHYLPQLRAEADDLLAKPVAAEHFLWLVQRRLQQSKAACQGPSPNYRQAIGELYNRRYFLAQLERTLAAQGEQPQASALLLILLENLAAIQAATGAAEAVTGQAAGRLRQLALDYQGIWFNNDMFALQVNAGHDETVLAVARSIRTALEHAVYRIGDHQIRLSVRIGAANANTPAEFASLVRYADMACHLAGERREERIHLHNPHADRGTEENYRRHLLEEIVDAAKNKRVSLVFQPIVSLRGDANERYEVFTRLRDEAGEDLLPETVFGLIQEQRMGLKLDRWVIAQAIGLLRARRKQVPATVSTTLFVNVTPMTLQENGLQDWLQERLTAAKVTPQRLVFEVSEATARRFPRRLDRFLSVIKPLGCRLALDRFGDEVDSLDLLNYLAADYIKLNSRFARHLAKDNAKQEQLQRILEKLADTPTKVIACGVEDGQTLPVLWSCGVHYAQGAFLQQPYEDMIYNFAAGV